MSLSTMSSRYILIVAGVRMSLLFKVGYCPTVGFPGGSDGKESACNMGDLGSTWVRPGFDLGWEDSPGGGHGNTLLYSCLENRHGQRSLAGYSPWDRKQSDMT